MIKQIIGPMELRGMKLTEAGMYNWKFNEKSILVICLDSIGIHINLLYVLL